MTAIEIVRPIAVKGHENQRRLGRGGGLADGYQQQEGSQKSLYRPEPRAHRASPLIATSALGHISGCARADAITERLQRDRTLLNYGPGCIAPSGPPGVPAPCPTKSQAQACADEGERW